MQFETILTIASFFQTISKSVVVLVKINLTETFVY